MESDALAMASLAAEQAALAGLLNVKIVSHQANNRYAGGGGLEATCIQSIW